MQDTLPIDDILPATIDALRTSGRVVLQAPPGAGKTTRVPLAMHAAALTPGRILMLEPRRIAARAAAERMAQTLGEPVGATVGYRIRGQSKVGRDTKIEVVTEGILTRMLQGDPELQGVGAVIFDEFHERSLNADLGLALCLEVAEALRDDLILVVMSATLDAEPIAQMMQAPVLTSQGRSFDVTTHWLEKPVSKSTRLENAVAELTQQALSQEEGSALVFLPGEGEIRRVQSLLERAVPSDVTVYPLFGAMDFKAQRAAIAPSPDGRKLVLATSIAETSLTIEGVRIVVDAGFARRSTFDASSGMARLVTNRVSRAEATQRAGRAGRTAPGTCFKLWTKGEDGALPAFPPAEIEVSDLTPFALELAIWGGDPAQMRFLTPPHAGRLAEAHKVLRMLGALDGNQRITPHGKQLAKLPLHPRLAHMVAVGGRTAPLLAALLAERDILRGATCDLTLRVAAVRDPRGFARGEGPTVHQPALARVRDESKRLARAAKGDGPDGIPDLAALAYPDRIGMRRKGDAPRYVLSGGKGAVFPQNDPLASAQFIVATDLDGDPREARIRQAVEISLHALHELFADHIAWHDHCIWSKRNNKVEARQQERLGALVLDDRSWTDVPGYDISHAMLDGVRQLGLLPSKAAKRLMARAALLHAADATFPDLSDAHLMATLEEWLLPHINGLKTAADWKGFDITPALQSLLGWDKMQHLDQQVPGHFTTPLGRSIAIEYDGPQPQIALRLQEVFGVTRHPTVAGVPVQMTLLSPAQKPVQVTDDLPGFWASSYLDVRKDMRGRYPKHPWPEDPTVADPTLRAKPRK
ncbi:MAG: ATP-dependent helicase HrpB [Roseobacter sp.]